MSDWSIDLIKSTKAKKISAPHRQACSRQCGNGAHGLSEIRIIDGIARPLVQCRADQSSYTGHQAGMLNSPRWVQQFWRDGTHLRVFQRFDGVLNPVALSCFNVVVEKNYALTAG